MRLHRHILVLLAALLGSSALSLAGVGNPQIRTDHPLYPGELAYSTPERLAKSALNTKWGLGLGDSQRDLALRFWLWRITHTIHDYSPRIWTPIHEYFRRKFSTHSKEHPIRPDPTSESFAAADVDRDAMRWQFSYGYGLCGTLHAVIGPQIDAIAKLLGQDWRSRIVGIPGDANHEIYFDGSWRAFDVNALTLIFSSDDPKTAELLPFRVLFGPKGGPKQLDYVYKAPKFNGKYLPKWTWAPNSKKNKYTADYDYFMKVFSNPDFYWDGDEADKRNHGGPLIYKSAYIACPVVYRLKKGESFTRWFNGDDAREDLNLPRRISRTPIRSSSPRTASGTTSTRDTIRKRPYTPTACLTGSRILRPATGRTAQLPSKGRSAVATARLPSRPTALRAWSLRSSVRTSSPRCRRTTRTRPCRERLAEP